MAAKKAPAKKAAKNVAAKKAPAKKAAEKAPAGPPVEAGPDPVRAQRKAEKHGRATDRVAWRQQLRGSVDVTALSRAVARLAARAAPAPGQNHRWVPIGPAVVRNGQAAGAPRVVGRIRQVQADATGRRAYAIGANGGVWYTDDGAATWSPVAPWAEFSRRRAAGGRDNAVSCGALLVSFDPGGNAAQDVVLVGTGEPLGVPFTGLLPNQPTSGGVGVLAKVPGGVAAVGPWEAETGGALMEGSTIFRLVRQPGRSPGLLDVPPPPPPVAPTRPDRVVACTDLGAFLGTRSVVGGVLRYDWQPMAAAGMPVAFPAAPVVTDAVWLRRGADARDDGRLVLAIYNWGLAFSDDAGATLQRVPSLDGPAVTGRVCLAALGTKGYVLGEAGGVPTLWQIADLTATPPVATVVAGAPAALWTANGLSQRDYDMALAVEAAPVVAGDEHDGVVDGLVDRVFLGGSTIRVPTGDWAGSVYCFDVDNVPSLRPAPGISTTGAPSNPPNAGAGADVAGLVGNTVHGDIHGIAFSGAAPARQVWVCCDGGVFRSDAGGRVNTFRSVGTGIAVLEPGFMAQHPSNDQFLAAGVQDNGVLIRTGDTAWETTFLGDGGGVAFHPVQSDVLISQYVRADWRSRNGPFVHPWQKTAHWAGAALTGDPENDNALFYSGVATVAGPVAGSGRIAIGTERIWLSDDVGATWTVLPFPGPAASVDPRPATVLVGGTVTFGVPRAGRPVAAFGAVTTIRWVSATELLAVFAGGIVRWTQAGTQWTAKAWALTARDVAIERTQTVTDVAPVTGTHDFYVTTVGAAGVDDETVWFYEGAADRFHRTAFRHVLDTGPLPAGLGPTDPAYAAVVDPVAPDHVYVGTASGVWVGTRQDQHGTHHWDPFAEGLPEAAVQDLAIWQGPVGAPQLLRAAVQSLGVWETDLTNPPVRSTYVRVHAHDSRRPATTVLPDPRRPPVPAVPLPVHSSPDVVVRPRSSPAAPPPFVGPAPYTALNAPRFELWTFQTAFRFLYPSVVATGLWTDAFADLVELHRQRSGIAPPGQLIDKALWLNVVGATRLTSALAPTTVAVDPITMAPNPFAAYRAPWHTAVAPAVAATEADLAEFVVPPSSLGPVWSVYRELSTVDVLLHHRDSRPATSGRAWAMLLYRTAPNLAAALASPVAGVAAYRTAARSGALNVAPPAGWTAVRNGTASRFPLATDLSARLPRAVSIDVDLTPPIAPPPPAGPPPPPHGFGVLLALVGSDDDDVQDPPVPGAPPDVQSLVQVWPVAALRVVQFAPRPPAAP